MDHRSVVSALALLVLAGCAGRGGSPIATPTLAPENPPCTSNIRVISGEVDAGAGHRFLTVRFNNVGQTACTLTGYPTVALVDADGKVVKHARHTLSGQAGLPEGTTEPPVITLLPGKSASTVIEASAIPEGDDPPCQDYELTITPPGQQKAVPAGPAKMPDCDVQVHPVTKVTPRSP